MQKDNTTLARKVLLRKNLLKELDDAPVILETHGGYGEVWKKVYSNIKRGIVFEKNPKKAEALAKQRPSWAVYECDCINALRHGVGSHLPVNFVDCDPYGQPWPVLDAFFTSCRPFTNTLAVVVNDGLRQKLKMNGGWSVDSLIGIVTEYGNSALYENYLDICQEILQKKAAQRGYALSRWTGYYCGYENQMTHYAAILSKIN